jgi:hypothetical protein
LWAARESERKKRRKQFSLVGFQDISPLMLFVFFVLLAVLAPQVLAGMCGMIGRVDVLVCFGGITHAARNWFV